MKHSAGFDILFFLTVGLALCVSSAGLFWNNGGEAFFITTSHGQVIPMFGQGQYRHDSLSNAASYRGADVITLFVCAPLAIAFWFSSRHGSLRGAFFLIGALVYFLYNGASMAFGVAYNSLFLVYIAYFSTSLFAFGWTFSSLLKIDLEKRVSPRFPHRGIAAFLGLAGLLLMLIWLSDVLGSALAGQTPQGLSSSTTIVTYVLDLAITVPCVIMSAIWLLQHRAKGYLLAFTMLFLYAVVGLVVVSQTLMARSMGVGIGIGQFIAFVVSFAMLSLVAGWLMLRFLRSFFAEASYS